MENERAGMAAIGMPAVHRLRRLAVGAAVLLAVLGLASAEASAACADDAVLVGGLCVDKYEASVWSNPPGGAPGTQYGIDNTRYPCSLTGENCDQIYAASLEGVTPSQEITWFQAQQACANVGKRLLTNAEWQMAAAGTPDTGGADDHTSTCNTDNTAGITVVPSGSRAACVSAWGAYDMVGNLWEWTADWVLRSDSCPGWAGFSDDLMCFAGADTTVPVPGSSSASQAGPGALLRGGAFTTNAGAGPLAISGLEAPTEPIAYGTGLGFRCARP